MVVRSSLSGQDASTLCTLKGRIFYGSSDLNRAVEMLHGVHRRPSFSAVITGAIDGHDQLT